MKIQLLFPPHWRPTQPYLSLPVLASHLRKNGFDVALRDINVEFFDTILSPEYLQASLESVRENLSALSSAPNLSDQQVRRLKHLFLLETHAEQVIGKIREAKRITRSSEAFNHQQFRYASQIIADGLELATAKNSEVILSFDLYRDKWDPTVSADVYQAIQAPDSFFARFFRQYTLASIINTKPDLVGISINSIAQLIPGLILAKLIRQQCNCHISIGGTHFSYIFNSSSTFEPLFDHIDSLVLFEGEIPLTTLAGRIANNENFHDIDNIITANNLHHQRPRTRSQVDLSTSDDPNFESLPLDLYFTPSIIYPLQGSRGCYWKRCKFCDYTYESPHYRQKSPSQVHHEVLSLPAVQEPRFVHLVDSAPTVNGLLELAYMIRDEETEVYWATMIRFEKQFEDPAILEKLYHAGCRVLEFGLESGSQEVLDMIDKGAALTTVKTILENCRRSGIFTVVFLIVGMPGETSANIEKTIEIIQTELGDLIDAISPNRFALKRHSLFGVELQQNSPVDLHQPGKDWCDELILPDTLTLSEEEMRGYLKEINRLKKTKPAEQLLRGTLWDVSYLLQYVSRHPDALADAEPTVATAEQH
ncbi:MAG: hypothetical protein CMM60_07850 [Rhodospirillaceae bacterium]|nr:hypothetical protein [Rhodospirillaceae bacterium]|tara:strand:+ start:8350 stop:10125 length:1776 start_codon:yes stop_codon:yes gene_type:complete